MKRHPLRQDLVLCTVFAICCAALYLIPEPPHKASQSGTIRKAKVVSVDNSDLQTHGLLQFGSQRLTVAMGEGKDSLYQANNEVRAQMELDKIFISGDKILVAVPGDDIPESTVLTAKDYDRTPCFFILVAGFSILLGIFGRWTGIKALFSFVLSCLVIWKAVIPLTLHGWPASWTIFLAVFFLSAVIQFLVAGPNRKGVIAFAGTISGVLAGLLTAHLFTVLMKINGAVMPYSQTLYYSGYEFLNLQDIFAGAMILASSGAIMDLAMDIASGAEEIVRHKPDITAIELIGSCLRIGQSVVGTMTTTLLLAYSGGYLTLLMMFASQNNSLIEILNNPLVAAEAAKTLIGSFSLILVAPLTALFSGLLLCRKKIS